MSDNARDNWTGFKWKDRDGDWVVTGNRDLFKGWEVYNVQQEFYSYMDTYDLERIAGLIASGDMSGEE